MTRIFVSLFLLFPLAIIAQNDLAIGQWKTHLPFHQAKYVTQSDDRIFFATEFGVAVIDKADFAVAFLSKTKRLSSTGIRLIKYNNFSNILLVAYTDGVIDLLKPDGTVTLSQIKNFNNIIGQKTINDIRIENDSIVYIAANYGISKLNILKEEFEFSTLTSNLAVNSITLYNNNIYAATNEGIYFIAQSSAFPENFGAWQFLEGSGFPLDYSTNTLAVYDNALYLDANDTLFRYDNSILEKILFEQDHKVAYLSDEGQNLMVGLTRGTQRQGKLIYFERPDRTITLPSNCTFNPLFGIEDNQKVGFLWFADQQRRLWYLENPSDNDCESLDFNSPYSQHVKEITIKDDVVWIASGGVNPTFSPLLRPDGIFKLEDYQWSVINQFETTPIKGKPLWDFLQVLPHPIENKVFAAAFVEGVLEIEEDNFIIYDDRNSSLTNAIGDETRTRVSGLTFDEANNLWVSNYLAERPISVLKADEAWQSFSTSGTCLNETQLAQVVVDQNGYKWFVDIGNNAGLLVLDTGEDLDNTSDDRCKLFTSANSELPTNKVNAVAIDINGEIWVATAEGVAVFQCFDAFDSDCDFFIPKTDQDENNLGLLLKSEDVRTIAIDGANRKWFGTTNGIFVQSPDGREELARFTAENSPLLDNTITDIAINPKSGEVFIGTALGLISYLGEATEGGSVNSKNVYAFPNPVRPEYEGVIAIQGLAENANVKITDINGQLIFETAALGGRAIWNGRDYNGRYASSGVYLVFATSNNTFTPDAIVTKILVMGR